MSQEQRVVKIYGLRRTGTNYFFRLIRDNYECHVLKDKESGWKHGTLTHDEEFPEADVVIITRNPQSWLPSIHRLEKAEKRAKEEGAFAEWAAGDWKRQGDGSTPKRREGYIGHAPLINTWNRQMGYWLYKGERIVLYEELLEEPALVCSKLAMEMDWERTDGEFSIPEEYVGPYKRGSGRADILQRQRSHAYLEKWDEASRKALELTIDNEVLAAAGYGREFGWSQPAIVDPDPYDGEVYETRRQRNLHVRGRKPE